MNPIEAMLAQLFDEVSDGVCAADAAGKVLYMNPSAQRLLEVTLSKSRGRSQCDLLCGKLIPPGGTECASGCALRDPGSGASALTFTGVHNRREVYAWNEGEFKRVEKSRALRVRCVRMPTAAGGGGVRITFLEDASAELELERRREDWRHMVAHDLRSPLTAIFAAAREMQEERPDSEMLRICVQNCRRMMALLDAYLDVAKLEAGLMPVAVKAMPLTPLLKTCVAEQEPTAREKRLAVRLDTPATLDAAADPELLTRVLSNLMSNAVKFTPEGGEIVVAARAEGTGKVVVDFRDTGPGISREDMPALFERYHRVEGSKAEKGTGLGLAFCREAVKAMKGTVSVVSRPGEGSTFTLELPSAGSLQHKARQGQYGESPRPG